MAVEQTDLRRLRQDVCLQFSCQAVLNGDHPGLDEVMCVLNLHVIVLLGAGVGSLALLDSKDHTLIVVEDVDG
jgi:hypothetical protein